MGSKRNLKRVGLVLALLIIGVFMTGFFLFVRKVNAQPPDNAEPADGIVALTGGSSRISDAVKLLADGRGRRLLVTGLNLSTSRYDLARMMGKKSYLVECCVDLDYEAVNTIGNAIETRKWAENNKFKRLIIVTSNYHMPRTLLELRRAYPKGVFIPQPVASFSVERRNWWLDGPTARILLVEYVKYLAAQTRIFISAGF